jgi:hypothetical protein
MIKLLTKKMRVPFTPFLTLAGVAIGALDRYFFSHDGTMDDERLEKEGVIR